MPAPRSVALCISMLTLSGLLAASLAAAQSAPPPAPTRESRFPALTRDYVGMWRSAGDAASEIRISPVGGSGINVLARGRFEAAGFASSSGVVALTRTPPADVDAFFDVGVLRLERLGPATLRARFYAGLAGAPAREETWTRAPEPLPTRPPGAERSSSGDPSLPAFGKYVYVEELPEAVVKVSPVYPDAAREHGIEGQVLIQALIGTDGSVKDTRVANSIPQLDAAAETSVRQWRFKPALSAGKPVAVWVAVPVKFSLH